MHIRTPEPSTAMRECNINPEGKGWVHCNKETMLKFIEFQIAFSKEALKNMYLARDAVAQRGMKPYGDLEIIAAPMGSGFTLWDNNHHHRIEVSTSTEWPEKI